MQYIKQKTSKSFQICVTELLILKNILSYLHIRKQRNTHIADQEDLQTNAKKSQGEIRLG